MTLPVVFFVFLVIAAYILLHKISIKLVYTYKNGKGNMELTFYLLWKFIPIRHTLRFLEKVEDAGRYLGSVEEVFETVERLIESYKENKRLISFALESISLIEINVFLRPDAGNACSTAILTGVLWAAVGSMDSLLTSYKGEYKRQIRILPEYSGKGTEAAVSCIFRIKTVNIILIAVVNKLNKRRNMIKEGEYHAPSY